MGSFIVNIDSEQLVEFKDGRSDEWLMGYQGENYVGRLKCPDDNTFIAVSALKGGEVTFDNAQDSMRYILFGGDEVDCELVFSATAKEFNSEVDEVPDDLQEDDDWELADF